MASNNFEGNNYWNDTHKVRYSKPAKVQLYPPGVLDDSFFEKNQQDY